MLNPIKNFISFDLETTGLDFEQDEIIEIGAVKILDGKSTESFTYCVRSLKTLTPLVKALTGLSEDMFSSALELPEAIGLFKKFCGDLPLVAHNSDFDMNFLKASCTKLSQDPFENSVMDSLLLARVAWPTLSNHRLETLAEFLQLPHKRAHRALPDAEKAAEVFLRAQDRLQEYSSQTLANLHHVLKHTASPFAILFAGATLPPKPFFMNAENKIPGNKTNSSEPPLPAGVPPSLEGVFEQEGALAKSLEGFEYRQHQGFLSQLVLQSLSEGSFLAVEAATGTGKSLAYLVAAALHALENRRNVYVSVAGRTLFEQVRLRDFPVLQKLIGSRLRLACLLRRDQYLSPRKFGNVLAQPETRLTADERLAFLPVLTWAELTETGEIAENCGFNHERHRVLWSKLGSEDPVYGGSAMEGESDPAHDRFASEAKENARKAHLVLIHHSLFMSDMALDFNLLPKYENIIFDEAERLVEAANMKLGRDISFFRLRDLLQLLASSKTDNSGLIREMESLEESGCLSEQEKEGLLSLCEQVYNSERNLQKFFNKIAKHSRKRRKDGESKIRFTEKVVVEFNASPEPVATSISTLAALLIHLRQSFAGSASEIASAEDTQKSGFAQRRRALASDLRIVIAGLEAFNRDFEHICQPGNSREIFWIEEYLNPHKALMRCVPASLGAVMAERFFPLMASAVFTSPALTFNDQFQHFNRIIGLDLAESERVRCKMIRNPKGTPTPAIVLTRIAPLLANAQSAEAQGEMLARSLSGLNKPTLILYTSMNALKHSREILGSRLGADGRMVLAQHVDGNRENLLHLLRGWNTACLLGTENFLDASSPGAKNLEILVISKLPFPVPTEPIVAYAIEKIQERGLNPLFEYLVPEAALRLKQMLSRLPRHPQNRRVVWILDPRLLTEKYGKAFTRLWDHGHIEAETEEDLVRLTREALQEPLPALQVESAE